MRKLVATLFAVAAVGIWSCQNSDAPPPQPGGDAGPIDCSAVVAHGRMQLGATGTCLVTCDPGFGHCGISADGPCNVNVSSDNGNCGGCGNVCDPSKPCANGRCRDVNALYASDTTMVPGGIAVAQGTVFWMNRGILFKLAPADIEPTIIAAGSFCPLGLATDGAYLYWPNCSRYAADAGASKFDGTILRVSINGGKVETLAIGQNPLLGIEIQAGTVVWLNGGPADGGAQGGGISLASSTPTDAGPDGKASIVSPAAVPGLVGLGAFGAKAFGVTNGVAFWIDGDGISSVPLDAGALLDAAADGEAGSPPASVLVPPPTGAKALGVGSSGVYWANDESPNPSSLFTANAGSPALVVRTLSRTRAMIVDGPIVYVASEAAGTIERVDTQARTSTTLAASQHGPVDLTVDDKFVYWITRGDGFNPGAILRAPK
jgi:hypothetical protein